jgi:PTH1 family peptidyl-tRNA hydrolase
VVGLGNPGPTYAFNRHNVGKMTAEALARRGHSSWKAHRMLKADMAEVRVSPSGIGVPSADAERVVLATTKTYMNESGVPVRNLLGNLKVKPDHLIVIHDELDIDFGTLRSKLGGGDNGHNGLRSIRGIIGTGDYYRVRIGIGRPTGRMDVTDWVLTNFSASDKQKLADMVSLAADAVETLITSGLEAAQQKYNS